MNRNRIIIMTIAPLAIMLSACMPMHRFSTPSTRGGCAIIAPHADDRTAPIFPTRSIDFHRGAWIDTETHETLGYAAAEDDIIWNHRNCIN